MVKNKKIYKALSVVLVLQLVLVAVFALYNCTVYNKCDAEENLFKIKLRNVQLSSYYLELYTPLLDNLWNNKTAVTTDENGFAVFKEKKKSEKTDNYFIYNYKTKFEIIDTECIVYPEGKSFDNCRALLNNLLPDGAVDFYLSEATKPVYLTAYIYKGVFLPKELYVEDELVLIFDKDKVLL